MLYLNVSVSQMHYNLVYITISHGDECYNSFTFIRSASSPQRWQQRKVWKYKVPIYPIFFFRFMCLAMVYVCCCNDCNNNNFSKLNGNKKNLSRQEIKLQRKSQLSINKISAKMLLTWWLICWLINSQHSDQHCRPILWSTCQPTFHVDWHPADWCRRTYQPSQPSCRLRVVWHVYRVSANSDGRYLVEGYPNYTRFSFCRSPYNEHCIF